MVSIQVVALIIHLDCIATVKFSTYTADNEMADIHCRDICHTLSEGSIDGQSAPNAGTSESVEKLEFEGS